MISPFAPSAEAIGAEKNSPANANNKPKPIPVISVCVKIPSLRASFWVCSTAYFVAPPVPSIRPQALITEYAGMAMLSAASPSDPIFAETK